MDKIRKNRKKQALRRRFEAQELIMSLKSDPCVDCKKRFHPCQMDFIHPKDHDGVSVHGLLLKSKKRILDEISKCVLVCANCGRLRIWKRHRALRAGVV